jgi:ribosome-associated heat shock protein Hsp15
MADQPEAMRLDKWLWAARFYKTRQDAVEAIKGGHVHLDGQRTKPGRDVHPGSRLRITKGPYEWDIEVVVLSKQRRPAAEAAGFYRETEASHARRQELVARIRAEKAAAPRQPAGRPSKRDRRMIHRFKQTHDG